MELQEDPRVLKRIYTRGYRARCNGETRRSCPYREYQLWAMNEWKRGYDDAGKKHKARMKKKFDLGKMVESPKPVPSKSPPIIVKTDSVLLRGKVTIRRTKSQNRSL